MENQIPKKRMIFIMEYVIHFLSSQPNETLILF